MKRILYFALILATLLSLAGCARLEPEPSKMHGLSVENAVIRLEGESPVQTVRYHLTIVNGTMQDVQVDWVKPVVDAVFKPMLGEQKLAQTLTKVIPSGQSLEVEGKFSLKTNGIPKEQLDKMGVLVKNFQISSRMSFAAPEVEAESPEPEAEETQAADAKPGKDKAEKPKATQVP